MASSSRSTVPATGILSTSPRRVVAHLQLLGPAPVLVLLESLTHLASTQPNKMAGGEPGTREWLRQVHDNLMVFYVYIYQLASFTSKKPFKEPAQLSQCLLE
ncbi:hypothetical protein WJX82_000501 [Trebouxia sp. C0006]